ncbi:MAG: hypothetical protein QOF30_1617 [Acidimicrobiaceae bacterium]|jgi:hypothetical protein|nr:hypothetical protein [Acidimicrobiaceae bacterium]
MAADAVDEVIHWVASRLRSQRWIWLLPLAVLYAMMHWPYGRIVHVIAGVVAAGVLAWAIKRPGNALIVLVCFLPLQAIGFGFLLRLHVPAQILRPAGGIKDVLAAGILLSALHALHVGRTRLGKESQLDAIDKVLLLYVAVVTFYLIFPHLFTLFPVTNRWSVRLLAWRADCGYVLLFFAVRHAPIPATARRRFIQVLIALTGLTVILGFYQWIRPQSWSNLILMSGRQVQYQLNVLGIDPATVGRNLGYLTNLSLLRVASVFISPFDMADFLLIPLAIAVERIARDYRSRGSYVLGAGILAVLFASRVRADALAAVIIAVVAMLPTPNRPVAARLRLLAAILVATAIIVPSLGGTRFVNAEGGAKSNQGHISEIAGGLKQMTRNPLGLGIGNVAGVGDRFVLAANRQGGFTVDNAVLQVGNELGFQAMLPWLLMVFLIWRGLGRAARRPDPFAGGIRLAFLAIFVAGMYHHVFLSFAVAWILWSAVGLALHVDSGSGGPELDYSAGNIDELDAPAADRN